MVHIVIHMQYLQEHGLALDVALVALPLPDAHAVALPCQHHSSSCLHLPPASWQVQVLTRKRQQQEGGQEGALWAPHLIVQLLLDLWIEIFRQVLLD